MISTGNQIISFFLWQYKKCFIKTRKLAFFCSRYDTLINSAVLQEKLTKLGLGKSLEAATSKFAEKDYASVITELADVAEKYLAVAVVDSPVSPSSAEAYKILKMMAKVRGVGLLSYKSKTSSSDSLCVIVVFGDGQSDKSMVMSRSDVGAPYR